VYIFDLFEEINIKILVILGIGTGLLFGAVDINNAIL
jgi:hypothetical protein